MKLFKTSIFPTNLYHCNDVLNQKDMDKIYKYIKSTEKSTPIQTHGAIQKHKSLEPLNTEIKKMAKSIFDDYFYDYEDFEITGMWATSLRINESHPPHTHANNFLSGVYFLKAADTSAKLIFYDPRPQAHLIRPNKIKITTDNTTIWNIIPKTNTIYLFPSWLLHYVETSFCDKERTSIAFNIMFKGKIGEINQLEHNEF